MIQVSNLVKTFGKIVALNNVSFCALDGQITGLLGPNGAGKTTCLRILYTILKPDSGKAIIDGLDVQQDPLAVQRRIGILPDSKGLYTRLTARENIRYYGQLHHLPNSIIDERIEELVKLLEMQDFINRRAEGFSSGQRTKVAIARALVHKPATILLDEPTNGLDVMSTRSMRAFIRGLREEGKCVLFSSHIMQEVSALCDNIVIIDKGRVAASGAPQEILDITDMDNLEDAFVTAIGSGEGLE